MAKTYKTQVYHYREYPLDESTRDITITQVELDHIERVVSQRVALAYQAGQQDDRGIQKDCMTLLSVSIHCLGGLKGIMGSPISNNWRKNGNQDEWMLHFMTAFFRILNRFDRNKGSWTSQVKWIRLAALRDSAKRFAKMHKVDKMLELLTNEVEDLADLNTEREIQGKILEEGRITNA